jgi:AhpD family alkylhydroperoxidase
MGYVSYLEKDQAAESIRPTYDDVAKKAGVMLNLFKAMAHNPAMLQGFLGLNSTMGKTKLPGTLRELAYFKASRVNKCGYCEHYHRGLGKKAGVSERQLSEVDTFESSDAYDDLEKDVLRFAEGVTRNVRADDAVVGRLKERLSDQELMELAMTVSLANLTNRMNESLKIDLP